jgi:hypothetical protein
MVVYWDAAPCSLVEDYNVSEVLTVTIIRAENSTYTSVNIPDYTAGHSRRQPSSYSPPRETEIK